MTKLALAPSNELAKILLNNYVAAAENATLKHNDLNAWLDIYETFDSIMSVDQRTVLLKQLVIATSNDIHNYPVEVQNKVQEYITNFKTSCPEETNYILDQILSMSDSNINDAIKLTTILYLTDINEILNTSKILSKNITNKIKIGISREKWKTIWPHLKNIKNDIQRINILSICMYSNMMCNENSTNTLSGLADMLTNVIENDINLEPHTQKDVWSILKSRCTGIEFNTNLNTALTNLITPDKKEAITSHINTIIRLGSVNLKLQMPLIADQDSQHILPADIKDIIEKEINKYKFGPPVNIEDIKNRKNIFSYFNDLGIWSNIIKVYPNKIPKLLKWLQMEDSNKLSSPFYNTIINLISSNYADFTDICSTIAQSYQTTLTPDEITKVKTALINNINNKNTKINQEYIQKLTQLSRLIPDIFKCICTQSWFESKLLTKLYNTYRPSSTSTNNIDADDYTRRLVTNKLPILIKPVQLEVDLLTIIAPNTLNNLYIQWSDTLQVQHKTVEEAVYSQDNFFFMWMQSELLHRTPISINEVATLSDSLMVNPTEIIESWGINIGKQDIVMPIFDMSIN